ncbi:GNAT family N-acetyltransferase [Shewanella sp. AS16]|uniref:GNAT family N-acetyltransferase n=1 Tax=Shewanella sp. AS16 TaxID=2907625 RepID=UPI001F1E6A01|nr:GNAT family protein [Shewanella sp. AS16]MCE9687887.1 GNAT family N-acetyltransferase [Shewanella sp. AS16]
MHYPTMSTPRLKIRAFTQADLPAFACYRALPEVARFQSWSQYSLADAQALFVAMNSVPFGTLGAWFQLALADTADQLIGDLALHFIDEQQLEIGFTLAPEFQGQGLATEALNALLAYLFEECGKHRLVAITDAENTPAWQLLERLHFRREGHFVENVFFKGHWGSEFQYALLASEWRTLT